MTKQDRHIFDWTRRLVAGVLLLTSVYLTWNRVVCEDGLATTGDQGAVRICRSVAITDPPVLGGLLLILLLLLPDLSEIGIPGFLSLKRRVQEQGSKLEEQEERLAALHAELQQTIGLQQTAVQDVDTRANAMSVNVLDIAGVLRTFETKAQPELLAASGQEHHSEAVISAQRAQLESRLLRIWARLEASVDADHSYEAASHLAADLKSVLQTTTHELAVHEQRRLELRNDPTVDTGEFNEALKRVAELRHLVNMYRQQHDAALNQLAMIKRNSTAGKWNQDFREEIQIVRAARNAVIRSEPIEDNKLSAAVRLAEGLLEAWKIRNGSAPEVADTPRKS